MAFGIIPSPTSQEKHMRIAIIGTGNVGGAIAQGLKNKGHAVTLGARDPDAPAMITLASRAGAAVATPAEAAAAAEVIILALPWNVAEAVVGALGDLSGRIVVDCMNPLGRTPDGLALTLGHTSSGGEIVQGWLPGARVVKTLNQVSAEMMADNTSLPHRPVMFMAGNDDAAKGAVAQLLTDLGFDPLDAGDITRSRLLEPFGMVWINQALFRGKGRSWAFAAVSEPAANP
jgi:predicted dinucleotide-binding enzyme